MSGDLVGSVERRREPLIDGDEIEDPSIVGSVSPNHDLGRFLGDAGRDQFVTRLHQERFGVLGPGEGSVSRSSARTERSFLHVRQFVYEQFVDHVFGRGSGSGPLAAGDRPQIGDTAFEMVIELVATTGRVCVG